MAYKKKISIVLSVIIIATLAFFSTSYYERKIHSENSLGKEETILQIPQPEKTDFGTSLPADFPANMPLEKGITVEQSYRLNYEGQNQFSLVFLSDKSVAENYATYGTFLEKEKWNISNKYQSKNLASLYGSKESHDINVTISEHMQASSSAESKVSISVLKK